jgi:hypothetical protein
MSPIGQWFQRLAGGKQTSGPAAAARGIPAATTSKYDFSLVACARWEAADIQEWVEYHRSIGFSHVYLYSNDEDPIPLFRAVAPYTTGNDPFVTFLHWPVIGQQAEIYLHFLATFRHDTKWYSFLDIDEFFVLKGVDNIARFMQDYEPHVDCLYFNWVLFGNNGKVRRDDSPTLTSYLRRARGLDPHTKLLCRSACIDPASIEHGPAAARTTFHHFIDNYKLPGVRCRDVLLNSTDGYSANFPASAEPFVSRAGYADAILDRAYIAHFQFRSEDDFIRRWRRGGFGGQEIWRSAFESGHYKTILEARNQVYDTYLAAYWHRHTANTMQVGMTGSPNPSLGENVALNKPSWQSSVYLPTGLEPTPSWTAGGGNNGVRTGTYGFHTNDEMRPWWIVDLLKPYQVAAIHIYNRRDRPDTAVRANELDVLASADGVNWNTLWSNPKQTVFGLNGSPLVVTAPPYLGCRFILLRLRGRGCLHLDEIEAYGTVITQPPPAPVPESGPLIPAEQAVPDGP